MTSKAFVTEIVCSSMNKGLTESILSPRFRVARMAARRNFSGVHLLAAFSRRQRTCRLLIRVLCFPLVEHLRRSRHPIRTRLEIGRQRTGFLYLSSEPPATAAGARVNKKH
jgi:hypothetical protein